MAPSLVQILLYLGIILVLVRPVGWYMACVYEGRTFGFLSKLENFVYRCCHIRPNEGMNWKNYLKALLLFNALGICFTYCVLRLQNYLPLNPQHLSAVAPDLAFNTAVSFMTNTDWQAYGGETTMSYFSQMLALTTGNFLSATTGMTTLVVLIRGIKKQETHDLGNFWVDTVRTTFYILLPLACCISLLLVQEGVIQNTHANIPVHLLEQPNQTQILPMGPVATQTAIAELGSNGGGFFNVNAAHPFANPTPLSNFIELLAILIIPSSLCYTFGIMVKDKRQGWAVWVAMLLLFLPNLCVTLLSEHQGNPLFHQMNIGDTNIHGNMEGKETRFGVLGSALWSTVTTATSNGSTNSSLEAYTPLGGLIPLWLMQMSEIVFGGCGSGLYGMLMFIILTVFIAGLMVGRTPEYLGKKIEPFEMKMASIAILVTPLTILLPTTIAVLFPDAYSQTSERGPHGFTEMLYAFTSMSANNGSAYTGLNANTPFYNFIGGGVMLIARYWIVIPVLAIAGSLVQKKSTPVSVGTLATHTPLFILFLIGIVIIVSALSFFPALSLGPIIEHFMLWGTHGT